jgi:thiamine pyrophosphate-dependent acetolactate synthase large subunit-like protein
MKNRLTSGLPYVPQVRRSHMLKDRGIDVILAFLAVKEMYRGIEQIITIFWLATTGRPGFMADGYARGHHGNQVCYVITGPGV